MPQHHPGAFGTLFIVAAATIPLLWDLRRGKRADQLNLEGRCARCGDILTEPGGRITIHGRLQFRKQAYACRKCWEIENRRERMFWRLIGIGIVAALVFVWWSERS